MPTKRGDEPQSVDRRRFLGASVSTAALPFVGAGLERGLRRAGGAHARATAGLWSLFGQRRRLSTWIGRPDDPLDALREHIGLTGSRRAVTMASAGPAQCVLDGVRVLSCLTLAIAAQGHQVSTIEGLARADGPLHPMQQAFVDNDAFQCGYCTPGQIMSAIGCVKERPRRRRRYDPRIHERQSMPLRGLSEHCLRSHPSKAQMEG